MSISRYNLERRKKMRYLREETLRLQTRKEKSQLTKPVVGLGGFGSNEQDPADKHDLEPTRKTDHPEMEYAEDPNVSLVSEEKNEKESEKKPWEKARDRKKDHQKEIQKKALDEAQVKWTVFEIDSSGEYNEISRGLKKLDAERFIDQLEAQDPSGAYVKQPDSSSSSKRQMRRQMRRQSNLESLFEALEF